MTRGFRRRYTNFTLVLQIDENGDCSYVVVPGGSTAPLSAEVVSGSAKEAVAAGNVTEIVAFTDARAYAVALEQDTSYDVYALCRDHAEPEPNYMENPVLLPVTTAGEEPLIL